MKFSRQSRITAKIAKCRSPRLALAIRGSLIVSSLIHSFYIMNTDFNNGLFKKALPLALAEAYEKARTNGQSVHSYVTSLCARYAEAAAKGAIFFGHLAVMPKEGSSWWTIRDMRHGWGYHPLDKDFLPEGNIPTEAEVRKALVRGIEHHKHMMEEFEYAVKALDE